MRLVQGAPTRRAIAPMADAIFAADRGYNAKETISFINETLGATGLRNHKRSEYFSYIFGNGFVAKRHRVMPVSEKGWLSTYRVRKKVQARSGEL